MGTSLSINFWTVGAILIALFTFLEILFLFARIIEAEVALHNLKVRSHTLRFNMLKESAEQMVLEWEYERERTGKSMDAIKALCGLPQSSSAESPPLDEAVLEPAAATGGPESAPAELQQAA